MKRLLILATLLILTACTAATVEPVTPTAVPSDTPLPTVSPTPTRTPFPTWPPPSPTPDFLDSPIANGFQFAPSTDPMCQLPCWQGLRVGESDKEDVLMMFDELLGIREGLRVSTDITGFPDMEIIGYSWDLEDSERNTIGSLALNTSIDQETGILKGIHIDTISFGQYKIPTPQQIIKELGSPSVIYADSTGSLVRLMLLYYEGIVSQSVTDASLEQQVIDDETKIVVNYCLNQIPATTLNHIVEPFDDIMETGLDSVQNAAFGEYLRAAGFSPIEEVFGLTVEEFVEIALDDENPCIVFE